jgi:hypothetical protein
MNLRAIENRKYHSDPYIDSSWTVKKLVGKRIEVTTEEEFDLVISYLEEKGFIDCPLYDNTKYINIHSRSDVGTCIRGFDSKDCLKCDAGEKVTCSLQELPLINIIKKGRNDKNKVRK